jgi:hypothetical protein
MVTLSLGYLGFGVGDAAVAPHCLVVDVASTSLTQRMASCGQPCRPPGLWVYALVCLPAGRYLSARRSRMRACRMWCQQTKITRGRPTGCVLPRLARAVPSVGKVRLAVVLFGVPPGFGYSRGLDFKGHPGFLSPPAGAPTAPAVLVGLLALGGEPIRSPSLARQVTHLGPRTTWLPWP